MPSRAKVSGGVQMLTSLDEVLATVTDAPSPRHRREREVEPLSEVVVQAFERLEDGQWVRVAVVPVKGDGSEAQKLGNQKVRDLKVSAQAAKLPDFYARSTQPDGESHRLIWVGKDSARTKRLAEKAQKK